MELIAISFATAFNFAILRWKIVDGRYLDTVFDISAMIVLTLLFGSTLGGMTIAMLSGSFISLYLLINPIKFSLPKMKSMNKTTKRYALSLTVIVATASIVYAYFKYIG